MADLVRKKNVLATMMQSFTMMAVITVLWGIVGYSLFSPPASSFIGGLSHAFLHGVGVAPDPDVRRDDSRPDLHDLPVDVRHYHPGADYGAFAERMKFSAMLLYHGAMVAIVYEPWRTWCGARVGC